MKTAKTIREMKKMCCLSTDEQLFEEMSNCLETEVNDDNYYDYANQFEASYKSWINACKGDY